MALPDEGEVDPRLLANPLKFGESPTEKYARLGSAYTQTGAGDAGSENQVASTQNFTKPDGTPVTDLAGVSGGLVGTGVGIAANALAQTPVGQAIAKGFAIAGQTIATVNRITDTAKRVTGAVQEGATVLANAVDKLRENPLELGGDLLKGIGNVSDSLGSFLGGFAGASAGGPPYPNVLDGFATYNCLWTMACLEPEQFNNPSLYRNNPSAIKHVVFSSAGRFDSARTRTKYGAPEYFIDNVSFQSIINPSPASGNTNVIGFSFEIYEPYSMGLFLQSLQVASVNAGYPNYMSLTPYLLMLQFAGNTDNGSVLPTNEPLTKYFTVMITKCDMSVDEAGSRYQVTAVPYHHIGFGDTVQTLRTEAAFVGNTVKEALSTGERSLVKILNKAEEELVRQKYQSIADQYEIVFPEDASAQTSAPPKTPDAGSATVDPKKFTSPIIKGPPGKSANNDVGSNEIGASPMPFKDSTSGNFVYKEEDEAINADVGVTESQKIQIDQSIREFRFPQGSKIIQVIQDTILVSKYATDAIKPERLIGDGLAKWFRIDLHIEMLEIDEIRGQRAKKYIFRILPFLVSGKVLKNPSAATAGTNNLKKIIAKRYDYIYTGRNNHVLKFDLTFNAMFFTGAHSRATGNDHTRDKDRNAATNEKSTSAQANAANTSAQLSAAGTSVVKNAVEKAFFTRSPVGDKTVEQEVADWFQKQFHEASSDLIKVQVDILGDPYFLSDSGLNTNYNAPQGPSYQIRSDGAMNYEGSQIFVFMAFRTPVEPKLGVSGDGGLYSFPGDGGISPFSGIYQLLQVENKWSSGTYTQTLHMIRVLGQDGDLIGKERIQLENMAFHKIPTEVPDKQSPASDADPDIDSSYVEDPEKTEELLQNADKLKQQTPGSGGTPVIQQSGRSEVIDIRGVQQEAKISAFNQALAEGKSEREADTIANRAGNLAGANALQSRPLTSGPTRSYQEYQQNFGTQNSQSIGQSTYLGTTSSLPVASTSSAPINYNDPQFQSQAQLDAEVANENRLLAIDEARRRR